MVGTLRADKVVVVFIRKAGKRWSTSCLSVFRFTRSLQNQCLCVFMVIVFESIAEVQIVNRISRCRFISYPPPPPPPQMSCSFVAWSSGVNALLHKACAVIVPGGAYDSFTHRKQTKIVMALREII